MMMETVGGESRMMPFLQAVREDAMAAVVAIATRLDIRDTGQ